MVNEEFMPTMDNLFEAHLSKCISTTETHVRAMYLDTTTNTITDSWKQFIQETVNQAMQPRFPGLFSEPVNILSNKNNNLVFPSPTQ